MKFTSEIIKKAWQIRKTAAQKFGCRVSEISWGLSLKMAVEAGKEEKKMEKTEEEYTDMFRAVFYPREIVDMQGTEKQRSWAYDIRSKFLDDIEPLVGLDRYTNSIFGAVREKRAIRYTGTDKIEKEKLAVAILAIIRNNSAKFWIENRNQAIQNLIKAEYNA